MLFRGAAAYGVEGGGEPVQPSDTSEDPRLPSARLPAGRTAEALGFRQQGAAQQPAQLSTPTQVR